MNSIASASLISLLNTQATGHSGTSSIAAGDSASANAAAKAGADGVSQASLQRAATSFKNATQIRALDESQKALAKDLQAAMGKAGVKLAGNVDFSLSNTGAVEIKGADADKAAVKSYLNADTAKPSFVNRIATQAKNAIQLSTSIQQHAAISQAAKYGKASDSVTALYTSLMQHANTTAVVFSVSMNSSSLTYPGSLMAKA